MRVGADAELEQLLKYNETQGITFKMKDDPRITKFGKFIMHNNINTIPARNKINFIKKYANNVQKCFELSVFSNDLKI